MMPIISFEAKIDVAEQQKLEERKQRDRQTAELALLLQHRHFRDFMWRVLEFCGMHTNAFHGEETHATAHHLGRREIGDRILQELFTADPHVYILMQQEDMQRAKESENDDPADDLL